MFVLLVGISVGIGAPRSMGADEPGTWEELPEIALQKPLGAAVAVWTGTEMLAFGTTSILGGQTFGARYDPVGRSWTSMNTEGAPNKWTALTAVWTGSEMLLVGDEWIGLVPGRQSIMRPVTARYDPGADAWRPLSLSGAPRAIRDAARIWTGQELLLWGGTDGSGRGSLDRGDGAAYDPGSDTWRPLAQEGAPYPRSLHTAVWTGAEMLVWGGRVRSSRGSGEQTRLDDGAAYDPRTDTWRPIAPSGLHLTSNYKSVWTGTRMLVWNNVTGAAYDPAIDQWTTIDGETDPARVSNHPFTLIWTGAEMLSWSRGNGCCPPQPIGMRYDPQADRWIPIPTDGMSFLEMRGATSSQQVALWTGDALLVWSGVTGKGGLWRPNR